MRNIEQAVAGIEHCETIESLKAALQKIIEDRGFISFAFLDISVPGIDDPLVIDTHREAWLREYRSNGFVHVDPMLPIARRTNTPFDWDTVAVPRHASGRKSGALKTMEAARDHGFTNGLVIPFHYIDHFSRQYSSVCTFFWSDRPKRFVTVLKQERFALHVICSIGRRGPLIFPARHATSRAVFSMQPAFPCCEETSRIESATCCHGPAAEKARKTPQRSCVCRPTRSKRTSETL